MATTVYVMIPAVLYQLTSLMLVCLFIGIFLNFRAMYNHFTILIEETDDSIETKMKNAGAQNQKDILAKQMLRKIIQFHTFAKE